MASKQVKRGRISTAIKKRLIETKNIILYPPGRWLWEPAHEQEWRRLREWLFLGCPHHVSHQHTVGVHKYLQTNMTSFYMCIHTTVALSLSVPSSTGYFQHPDPALHTSWAVASVLPGQDLAQGHGCCFWVSAYWGCTANSGTWDGEALSWMSLVLLVCF